MRRYWVLKAAGNRNPGFQDTVKVDTFFCATPCAPRIADVRRGDFFVGGLDQAFVTGCSQNGSILEYVLHRFVRTGLMNGGTAGRIFFHPYGTSTLLSHREEVRRNPHRNHGKMDEPIATQHRPHIWLSREPANRYGGSDGKGRMSSLPGTNTTNPYLRNACPAWTPRILRKCLRGSIVQMTKMNLAGLIFPGFPFTLPFAIRKRVIHPDYFIPDAENQFYMTLMKATEPWSNGPRTGDDGDIR